MKNLSLNGVIMLFAITTILYFGCQKKDPEPEATCTDGIQNQSETGMDCGGPCTACPSCSDGIKNQGETDTDCGGPCPACPSPSMSAKVNGNAWVASSISYMNLSGHNVIGTSSSSGNSQISFRFSGSQTGTYNLDGVSGSGAYVLGGTSYTQTALCGNGTLVITKFQNNRITGTFSFEACNNSGTAVMYNVTEGVITDIKLE